MNPWTRRLLSAMLAGLLGGCATQDNRLSDTGYQVYIPEARVKGRDWMRLRVGFFASRADAERAANEVMRVVRTAEQPWIAQVTPDELARFAGY